MFNLFKRRRNASSSKQKEQSAAGSKETAALDTVYQTKLYEDETSLAAQTEVIEGNEDSDWALWADSVLASEAQESHWHETVSFHADDAAGPVSRVNDQEEV